jgi:hypothetical protein
MVSGNFLIGNDLKLDAFDQYVIPTLRDQGFEVSNKIAVRYNNNQKAILVSVEGEGDLEKSINQALIDSGEVLEEEMEQYRITGTRQLPTTWDHNVRYCEWENKEGKRVKTHCGIFKTLGSYDKNDTASSLFPILAQKYLFEETRLITKEFQKQVRALMQRKLKEL